MASKQIRKTAAIATAVTPELMRKNALLHGLDQTEVATIAADCKFINLSLRQVIYEPEVPIETVYFPIDSVLSVVTQMADGSNIEIGTIGREGMSAFPLLMGASSTANDSYCQVPGSAITMSVAMFRTLSHGHADFRQRLDRYLQAYVNMLGQLAACNRLHSVYERCSRWLLMTFDRVGSDRVPLTHEYLAMMLGTGRSGVTIAAATLQQAGFIEYRHGYIQLLDRAGLQDAACECYSVAQKQFDGLLRHINRREPAIEVTDARSKRRKATHDARDKQTLTERDV